MFLLYLSILNHTFVYVIQPTDLPGFSTANPHFLDVLSNLGKAGLADGFYPKGSCARALLYSVTGVYLMDAKPPSFLIKERLLDFDDCNPIRTSCDLHKNHDKLIFVLCPLHHKSME